MSIRKGKAPKEIEAHLTIVGQGSSDKLKVTYHNRKQSEIKELVESGVKVGDLIPFIVKEWDTDFDLTSEGVTQMEDEYPGLVDVVLEGFREARAKHLEKNS